MIHSRKLLFGGLVLLVAAGLFSACGSERGTQLSTEKVSQDLVGKIVTDSTGAEFRIGTEQFALLKGQEQAGGKTVARVALRAIDPKTSTGIEGEVELTYQGDGALTVVSGKSVQKMEGKYAARLTELVDFPLHFAANIGDPARVAAALKKGVEVNAPEAKKASTALMFAAERGFVEIVKTLLAQGANLNHQNKYGFAALHAAASNNHAEVVKLLLEKGAQVDPRDELGQTPLYFAAERGYLEVVRLLVARGADVHQPSKKGWPPLYAATSGNFPEVVKFLIEHGAKVNVTSPQGTHSPLLIAAFNNNPEMVRLLLAAGADPAAKLSGSHASHRNQTALDIARKQGNQAIVDLLQKKSGS